MIRVGQGYDVHQLVEGRPLVLGGVTVDHNKGLAGHSDADVVVHSLCDALLGAAGKGDIGQHFPDTDSSYKNIDSRILLRKVMSLLQADDWQLVNADLTIIAQAPKLAPHIPQMRSLLSNDMNIDETQLNIKATTTEELGYCGREEGIAALAIVLLERSLP
jgi:2-C-methyl-D-erythritol 2,4-cyclodiphosphate synthase